MATLLSDENKTNIISAPRPVALNSDTLASKSSSKEPSTEDKKPPQYNLTTKITSLYASDDPFKGLYRAEWRAHTTTYNSRIPQDRKPGALPCSPQQMSYDLDKNKEELTSINSKVQNLTLQRVLALRKVQHAIQSAPNASAVGADSTSFSEDDLKCLTMEELQSLQKRKRAIHKELQPLSVVKVSIQAERSRKRLEPRDYQIELYERARRENTIAVLGTGTGKTLIACLLIKDILVQERVNRISGMKVLPPLTMSLTSRRNFVFLWCRWYILFFNREMSSKPIQLRARNECVLRFMVIQKLMNNGKGSSIQTMSSL
jgi:hypothetical protein